MRPGSEEELARMVKDAPGPLQIRGGGTRGARLAERAKVLETGALSGVRLYEPGALTLIVGAGTPLSEIETLLAGQNQRLAFEPGDLRAVLGTEGASTIGGVVATNACGPRRIQVGACRDFLLGVRLVDGAGRIISNGGRVMKNVTGYDLVKLMAGSWGTLGVLTEVSLKVLACPETEATLILRGQGAAEGVKQLCRAMGTPWDVSGVAWVGAGVAGGAPECRIRVEGLKGSAAYRAGRLSGLLSGEIVEGEESVALWRQLRDLTPFAGKSNPLWRITLKPTDAPLLLDRLGARAGKVVLDWSGGLMWLETEKEAEGVAEAVRLLGGNAVLMRGGAGPLPVFLPRSAGAERLAAALRQRFDPRGILNPGLMGRRLTEAA